MQKWYIAAWYLLIIYLLIRSYEYFNFMLMLAAALILPIYFYHYRNINHKLIIYGICIVSILFYAAYIGQGIYSESILNTSRFSSQGITWPGSSYAVFYYLVSIPCAIFIIKGKTIQGIAIGSVIFLLAIITAWYYDSRILKIIIPAFAAVSFYNNIKIGPYLLITAAIIGILLIHPFSSDYDRIAGIIAPIRSLEYNTLFGYGCNNHHTILPGYFSLYGNYSNEYSWSKMFARITTDYGITGLLLFSGIWAGSLAMILKSGSGNKPIVITMLLIGISWVFINDIYNNFVWWALYCPYGIPYILNKNTI